MGIPLESITEIYNKKWKNFDFSDQNLKKPLTDTIKQAFPNQELEAINILKNCVNNDNSKTDKEKQTQLNGLENIYKMIYVEKTCSKFNLGDCKMEEEE